VKRLLYLFLVLALGAALITGAVIAGAGGAGAVGAPAPPVADTVYTNGVVYLSDAAHTTAQAVAVKDGRIVYVGDAAGAAAFVGAGTASVDLGGKLMLPGFIDSHMHASMAVSDLYEVSLYGLKTVKAYQKVIRSFADAHPEVTVVQGSGWSNTAAPGIGPTKQQLDAAVGDRPAVMFSEDGHSAWCDSAALKLAGITSTTKDPKGGVIERVPGTNTPSGTLREAAVDLVTPIIPAYNVAQMKEGIRHFQQDVAAPLGLTTATDVAITPGDAVLDAYQQLAEADALTVRMRGFLNLSPEGGLMVDQVAAAVAERAKHTTPLFRTDTVKLFVDGVVEGHTALLNYPYKDKPGFLGVPVWPAYSDLQAASIAAAEAGFQLHYHCIGDAATSQALNAIAAAGAVTGSDAGRPGITHLQLVTPTDFVRFAQLKVTAAPQPYWFVKDDYYYGLQLPYLGKWRADREYPMKSFFDNGVLVASSSDYPVTYPPDPLDAIQTGVMRWIQSSYEWAKKGDVLWPAERVTVQQMIDSFTIAGARANFLEDETGSIEVGKSADMVVLDTNILTCPVERIGNAAVLQTIFRGVTVYDRAAERTRVNKLKEGIHSLQIAIQSWTVDNGDKFPPASVVTEEGLKLYFPDGDTPWPGNPWTGEPMKPGTDRGDYTYARLNGGRSYRLAGHISATQDYVVP
jgi:predicted amidohydrolase YtcJ